jgi:hypothetical protein
MEYGNHDGKIIGAHFVFANQQFMTTGEDGYIGGSFTSKTCGVKVVDLTNKESTPNAPGGAPIWWEHPGAAPGRFFASLTGLTVVGTADLYTASISSDPSSQGHIFGVGVWIHAVDVHVSTKGGGSRIASRRTTSFWTNGCFGGIVCG